MNPALLEKLSPVTAEEKRLLEGHGLEKEVYSTGNSFVIDSEKMLAEGQLVRIRPHTRFVEFPDHAHNYIEMIYMCSGTTTHTIDRSFPITLETGEILLLNQHVTHSVRQADKGDIGINVMALPQFFDTAFEMIGPDNMLGKFLANSLRQHSGQIGYLHFKVAEALPVQNLMENLIWSLLNPRTEDVRIHRVTMGLLFLELLQYTQHMELPEQDHSNNALVVATLREIETNYPTANLTQIAKNAHVSLGHLSTLIREGTGSTFKELLQEKRLSQAMELLQTTTLSVKEIMGAVGYQNSSYFYRIFREKFGGAPSQFRKTKEEKKKALPEIK